MFQVKFAEESPYTESNLMILFSNLKNAAILNFLRIAHFKENSQWKKNFLQKIYDFTSEQEQAVFQQNENISRL